ncbi:hypothetical protein Pfra02_37350 [Pseudomonas fragi]|nr:hypothetical protein Pfra02_37350 [Pseudomonas fragi]
MDYQECRRNPERFTLTGFVDVSFTPEEVSSQIVNGINYRYKSIATISGSISGLQAIVEIYAPINGKPYITQPHRI